MKREIKIIDLDGTLCRRNTFVCYVRWCAGEFLRGGKISALAHLAGTVMLRKLRAISHREAKWRIMSLTLPHFPEAKIAEFTDTLIPYIRTEILRGEAPVLILATAAPYEYASLLARTLGFTRCIATTFTTNPASYHEIRSGAKATAVREYLEENGLTDPDKYTLTLYTDANRHTGGIEDAPLTEYIESLGGSVTVF